MKEIDGAFGEGGGQILRTSIALSAVTGIPIKIRNIRAKRRPPGLKAQHLTAVKSVAKLVGASVKGLRIGSTEITFIPGEMRPGSYFFDVGTAGSISLVLQALLPAMAFAEDEVEVTIRGGTAVTFSPPVNYIEMILLPHLRDMGANVTLEVIRHGFYPRGGGIVKVRSKPIRGALRPIMKIERGRLRRITGAAISAKLPSHIVKREAKAAKKLLSRYGVDVDIATKWEGPELNTLDPGTFIVLRAEFEKTLLGADALGARGKRAEKVGEEAAKKLAFDIDNNATVDVHMGDQLILWMALAKGKSMIRVSKLTMHAYTCIYIVKQLLENVDVSVEGSVGELARITIQGAGLEK